MIKASSGNLTTRYLCTIFRAAVAAIARGSLVYIKILLQYSVFLWNPPVLFRYPEIKAIEGSRSILHLQLLFQDNKTKLGESKETHCTTYIPYVSLIRFGERCFQSTADLVMNALLYYIPIRSLSLLIHEQLKKGFGHKITTIFQFKIPLTRSVSKFKEKKALINMYKMTQLKHIRVLKDMLWQIKRYLQCELLTLVTA